VIVNVSGVVVKGQAEAIRLGIARSLVKINPEYKQH
jgi:ribosomal protein S9